MKKDVFMKKDTLMRLIAIVIALAGFLILWQSTVWGLKAFPMILMQVGSLSGDVQTRLAYEGPVAALRTTGAILIGIGLYRAIEPSRKS